MWSEPSDIARSALSVLVIGIAVKLLDDCVDGEERTLFGLAPAGAAVYAVLAAVVGTALAPPVALPLFAAAYAMGMMHEPGERLPSGLPAWLEAAFVLAAAAAVAGTARTAQALLVIATLQALDDLIDFRRDAATPHRNWAHRIGCVETALIGLICLTLATAFGVALPVCAGATYGLLTGVGRLERGTGVCFS